jgi:hypothetical protein
MFAKDRAIEDNGPSSLEAEYARLRRGLIIGTFSYLFLLMASLTGCVAMILIPVAQWVKSLPQGAERSWERLMQDAPHVFYISVAGGVVGLLVAAGGFALVYNLLGRDRRPPKLVIVLLSTTPLFLTVMGLAGTLKSGTGVAAALMLPIVLGYAVAFVPMELGLLAMGLASLAVNQLRQRPVAINSAELPAAAAEYLNTFEADALEAGLTPLGDYTFLPERKKFRRYWMAPNGAYFVDASWIKTGQSTISAMGVSSATSDGHYFETVDQPLPAGAPAAHKEGMLTHVTYLPGEPLPVLLEQHIEVVGDWAERAGCRPLEFAVDDLHAFTNYGIAAFMRETRNDLLWLGNPYAGQPLPPLPGRPWQREDALAIR